MSALAQPWVYWGLFAIGAILFLQAERIGQSIRRLRQVASARYFRLAEPKAFVMVDLLNPDLWDRINKDTRSEVLRQSEMMVGASVTLAHAADTRATTAMNVFGAGAIALIAAAATLLTSNPTNALLAFVPFISALGFFAASICCGRAISPVRILLPGARPSSVLSVGIYEQETLLASLVNSAERSINHNMTVVDKSADWFKLSLYFAASGIIGGIGGIILWYSYLGAPLL